MDVQILELGVDAVLRAALVTVPVFLTVWSVTWLGQRWLAPWARHALWSLVLCRLLLPVSVESAFSLQPQFVSRLGQEGIWNAQQSGRVEPSPALSLPEDERLRANSAGLPIMEFRPAAPAVTIPVRSTIATGLSVVLLGGMLLVAGWTILVSRRLNRWVRRGSECRQAQLLTVLSEGQQRFGIRGKVTLRTVPGLVGPATCGWLRPAILLPEDAANWSLMELRHVLWHELAHIARQDVAWNWLSAVVRVVHWWNPMFWWAQRCWLAERELACDALALGRLEGAEVAAYGETLLRFMQRLAAAGNRPAMTVPGMVQFGGRKREARRRLMALAQLSRPEPVWRRRMAVVLIAVLAGTGLMDAAPPPRVDARAEPIELPEGTTWSVMSPAAAEGNPLRSLKTYDLTATVERLRQDDPDLTAEGAILSLQQLLQSVIQPTPSIKVGGDQSVDRSKCTVAGQDLVAFATAAQHHEIQRLLNLWSQAGLQQACFESRFITTSRSLTDLLPGAGGVVFNLEPKPAETPEGDFDAVLQTSTQSSMPAFLRILSPEEATAFSEKLQSDRDSNILYAPKVTLFDGLTAAVLCGTERPFVTGLQSTPQGAEPQISVVPEGLQLRLRAQASAQRDSTQLQLFYQQSQIDRVDVLETRTAGKSWHIQIPQVSRSVVTTVTDIPAGHSLLVAPLSRDRQGKFQLCLIRYIPLP